MMKTKNKITISINGGIGRNIAFTGVLKEFIKNNKDKEINLLASFPEIFMNIEGINKIYPFHTPYLYDNVIKDSIFIEPEPYKQPEYYNENKHITYCFNKELNNKKENINPNMSFTKEELMRAKGFVDSQKKPVILIQPFGSGFKEGIDKQKKSLKSPFIKDLVKELEKDYKLFIIKSKEQKIDVKVDTFMNNTLREQIALLPFVKALITVDSFMLHAASQFNTKTFCFWGTTREGNLGYDKHINIRNDVKLEWQPIRLPNNNIMEESKNVGINEFYEKHINKIKEHYFLH